MLSAYRCSIRLSAQQYRGVSLGIAVGSMGSHQQQVASADERGGQLESEVDFIGGGAISPFLVSQVAPRCVSASVTCHIGCSC